MARFAEIENSRVVNILEAEADFALLQGWVLAAEGRVGDLYDARAALFSRPSMVPEVVPGSVSRRQFRQALLLAGRFADVEVAVDALQDPVQRELVRIEWNDSQAFEHERPLVITLATALGIDKSGLERLFIAAGRL